MSGSPSQEDSGSASTGRSHDEGLLGRGLVVVSYLGLALLLTWPLVLHLHDGLIGHEHCTNRMHLWVLWIAERMLFSGQLPIHTELIFYPFGTNLVRLYGSDLLYPLVLSPLTHLFSAAVVFNLKILLSLTLAPVGTYLLLRHLGARRPAAWGGGALYVSMPYFLLETLNGVSELVAVEWVPFAVLYLLRCQQRGRRRDVMLAVVFTLLASYSSGYNAFFLFFFGAVLVGHQLITARERGRWWRRLRWRPLGLVVGLCVLGLVPYVLLHRSGGTVRSLTVELSDVLDPSHRPMADSSASVATFLRPGRNQIPLVRTGENGRQEVINTTHTTYLGYGVLVLALFGLRRGRRPWLWGATAAVFVVIALGPHLCISGDPVVIGGVRVPLPAILLYKMIPGFDVTLRHSYRYVAMVHLALAVLAGLGLHWILGRLTSPAARRAAALGAVAICLTEVLTVGPAPYPIPITGLQVPAIYHQLAADQEPYAIIELPHEDDLNFLQPYLYYQTVHGKPMIDGAVHSRVSKAELAFIRKVPLAWAFIHEENMLARLTQRQISHSRKALRAARYRYALVHEELFESRAQARKANARMVQLFGQPTGNIQGIRLYDLRKRGTGD